METLPTSTQAIPSKGRVHYLDALRAVIMCLGIFVHAASWAKISNGLPQGIAEFSHLFRMKLFIFLGAYFVALQIPKRGVDFVVKDRLRRLGVPILVFLLVFNPLTIYLWNIREHGGVQLFYYTINMPTDQLDTHGSGWHLHIWFLIVLLAHCLVYPIIHFLLENEKFKNFLRYSENIREKILIAILAYGTSLLFLAGRTVHFLIFQKFLHDGPFNYLVQAFLTYLPIFVLGIIAFRNEKIFRAMHVFSIIQVLISLSLWIACQQNYELIFQSGGKILAETVRVFSQELFGFYIGCILLKIFSMYASNPSKFFRSMSDASYTVYLFHMIIIVVLQSILLNFTQNNFVLYIVSIPTTFIACILIHKYLVEKSNLAGFLFNGRPLRGKSKAVGG